VIDPFAPAALEDPYPLYDTLRREQPVYQLPETGIWLVTRHADLIEATGNPEIFSSHISAIIYAGQGTNPTVIPADPDAIGAVDVLATQDPPAHTVQRRLVARAFSPAKMADLDEILGALAGRALDDAKGASEWMSAVADLLPVAVIGRFLGLPDVDLPQLRAWADAGIDLISGVATPERMMEAWQEMVEFLDYLRACLSAPQAGTVTHDIASAVERHELSDREGVSLMLQLVIAGSESTASLIGNSVRILAERSDVQQAMRDDPEHIAVFLEEVLRLESPFRGHFRVTTRATRLGGVALPEGARVMLMWGAANRDDAAFPDAASLDLGRPDPKSHVAFGSGIHFCIGAPLARREALVVLQTLLARTSWFSRSGDAPRHVPSLFVRRLESLHLELKDA